ncbi:glycosyltransferase [Xanthomarina sp. F1114]|uniref:glycosyltransferase family 2 protein n=1 Tax=Xanthomarina sp. F1114 TaxID=2996019 RepID=UPI00225E37B8|nr:glycosyltransferase [Xanthomarina sp. F1114]MCX7547127.1 glycosyltransferase [Xanthomarina sp. F1114]
MKPVLTICCTTFNQEKYVEKTLEGFYLQKTTFPIEIQIHDDASTDGTQAILKKHAEKDPRIKLILQTENKYSQHIMPWWHYSFPQAKGKYIALCEGDDYWTDPLKLQKQVDFLESNPDYVISWTNYKIFNGSGFLSNQWKHKEENTRINYNNIFSPYCTLTLTAVFKKEALNLELLKSFKYSKDNSLYIVLLQKGSGVFMDFESAVYRVHEGGVYSLQSDFFKNYSSYLNVKEASDAIPESKTANIKKVIKSLGNATAFEVLKLKNSGEELSKIQLDFMETYFQEAGLKTKFKYYKRLLKHQFLK